ncbi:MAG: 30S ribosomal protein S20 [Lachnospiraceae bacterium]|jgi:small subunit ribosomal protein S20|nr:30S ribosomal protein S20 [Lachnospiraceae bacterium]
MANIKSAKKRIITSRKRALKNKMEKSAVKTAIRRVREAIELGDKDAAQEAYKEAVKKIEKAGSHGVYKKNNVSRKVSKVAKAVNALQA